MSGFLQRTKWLLVLVMALHVHGQTTIVPTEIMYNPKGSDDYEFVEFYNAGATAIDLTGYVLVKDSNGDGLFFAFPSMSLESGAFLLLAEKSDYFTQRYQTSSSPYYRENLSVVGTWSGGLGNRGEVLILQDATGQEVFQFKYDEKGDWPVEANGLGSSLELKDAEMYTELTTVEERNKHLADGVNWRASADYHGNPGRDGGKAAQSVVINEILANTDGIITDTVEIYNPTTTAINIGGWYLSDSTTFEKYRIPDDTSVAAGSYVTFDESQFNPNGEWNPERGAQGATEFSFSGSKGDQVYLVQTDASGNLIRVVDHVEFGPTRSGESIGLWTDEDGVFAPMASFTSGATNSGPRIGPVVITEIMYNPGTMINASELEFIEIHNSGTSNENLDAWSLETAVSYSFPQDTTLAAGSYLLVVGFDPADTTKLSAFQTQYRTDGSMTLLGPWSGSLNNGGETIQLKRRDITGDQLTDTNTGNTYYPLIIEDEVAYSDGGDWPSRADGDGPTLTKKNSTDWGMDGDNWRSSNEFKGNPGTTGTPQREIAITEILAHTDYPLRDTIELYNPGTSDVDIGGWYLSDTSESATNTEDFRKYQIPDGTTIPAGGYLTFDESQFNPNVNPLTGLGTPAANHFALASAYDEDVALIEADASDNLLRIVDHVAFGPSENGISFGMWPDLDGRLYPMKETTLGTANTGPAIGSVVISEIHYNPGDMANTNELEFVELYNTGNNTAYLEHWKLDKAVSFSFSSGHTIPTNSALVVVGFDVADTAKLDIFRTQFGIDSSVNVVGPWTGTLSNAGEALELQNNDVLEVPLDGSNPFYPMVLAERLRYRDDPPWPVSPDGQGNSLERVDPYTWSDTDSNWGASTGTPTPGSLQIPNFAPKFTSTATTAATEDLAYTYAITTTDSNPGDTLTLNDASVAVWLKLTDNGDGTGILSGNPSNEYVGPHIITLSVTDGSEIVQQTFTIEVANTNDSPGFTSTAVTTAMNNRAYNYSITTNDPDTTDNLTIAVGALPSWLTFADNRDGTASLSGTPTTVDIGDHSVSLSLSDGTISVVQTFTVTVAEENFAPTAISLNNNLVAENIVAPYSLGTLSATDQETADTHTFSLTEGTGGTDNASFTVSGKSLLTESSFDFESKSTYEVRIRVTDSTDNTFDQAFTILVTDDSSEDADGDGLTELQEEALGTSDLETDSDGDGTSDPNEHTIGSDASNSASFPSALSPSATILSGGWKYLSWFGLFQDNYDGWVFHLRLGWLYVNGINTDSLWIWDSEWDWLWTSAEAYPKLYSHTQDGWIYYYPDVDGMGSSDPRWFLDYSTSTWQQGPGD